MQPGTENLTQLGAQSPLPASPHAAILEVAQLPDEVVGESMCFRFTVPEFTSICPVTGQPDFAHFIIDYVPKRNRIIESKSLKLFMGSFRNHPAFHEATTFMVASRLYDVCVPEWMRVVSLWYPRGGIPIDVFWQTGEPPAGVHIPPIDYKHFNGR